ncbi:unnamed protein product [Microthlaspi erraticum]|uniref:F-box domain-containing protein n=1 Tax=Microthlaspi erraticum TaxID=1685480 RepID=A0A6D2HWB1_9BRAS|nr:unnamed protein product [Microthlaspi erraticum]
MSDLLADLVEEILSRVPAKSLSRFRSTCKRFNEEHFCKAPKQSYILIMKEYRLWSMSVDLNIVPPSIGLEVYLTYLIPILNLVRRLFQLSEKNNSQCSYQNINNARCSIKVSNMEMWVTNKIDTEAATTAALSWSKCFKAGKMLVQW